MVLHEEIVIILKEHGSPMFTRAIADELNRRKLYSKKDGSPISDFQVHGPTRNYPDIFCRTGSQVSLLEWNNSQNATAEELKHAPSSSPSLIKKDSVYIIDLCDSVLGVTALREHRFSFLRGDANTSLPVDAYYHGLKLVIEYREKQHTEKVSFFDKPERPTVSGVHRGQQRAIYDQRRRDVLPKHGIELIELLYSDFAHDNRKRLMRDKTADIKVVREKLAKFIKGL